MVLSRDKYCSQNIQTFGTELHSSVSNVALEGGSILLWPESLLIVDDQAEVRDSLIHLFEEADIHPEQVYHSNDVKTANDLFDAHAPDLTLVDVVLLGESGFDVVRHIREKNSKAAVIMMTAYPQFNYAMDAIRYHVDHFLVKPITLSQIEAALLDVTSMQKVMTETNEMRLVYRVLNRILLGQEDLSSLELIRKKLGTNRLTGSEFVFAVANGTADTVDFLREQGEATGVSVLAWEHDSQRIIFLAEWEPKTGHDPGPILDQLCRKSPSADQLIGVSRASRETGLTEMYRRACFAMKYAESRQVTGIPVFYEHLDLGRVIVTDSHASLMEAFDRRDRDAFRTSLREMNAQLKSCAVTEDIRPVYNEMLAMEGLPLLDMKKRGVNSTVETMTHFDQVVQTLPPLPPQLKLSALRRYLLTNLKNAPDQEALESLTGISYGYISSLFSQYTGRSLNDCHRAMRLRRAAELLRCTDEKVNEITKKTGYEGNKHFYSLFQKTYGQAPAFYHDSWRNGR